MKTIIKKILPSPDGRLIAVSDIHGHLHYLKGLLEKVHFSKKDTLVIIGDMIEKGPESLNTVRFVMELLDSGYSVHVSMGNVEYHRMARFEDDSPAGNREFLRLLYKMKKVWGGSMFLDMLSEMDLSLEDLTEDRVMIVKAEMRERFKKELFFLKGLPAILAAGDFIFVHGGIPTDHLEELEGTEAFTYLKQDEFLRSNVKFEKYVVTGHWPVCLYRDDEDSMEPICDWEKHIIALDGGCGLKIGQQLNGLILPGRIAGAERIAGAGRIAGVGRITGAERITETEGAAAEEVTDNVRRDVPKDVRETVGFVSYDDFPVITADHDQAGRRAGIVVHYWDSEVELLGYIEGDCEYSPGGRESSTQSSAQNSTQSNAQNSTQSSTQNSARVVRLRHISSGMEFPAPESFLYKGAEGQLKCEDCSDALLEIKKGDLLSVVEKTSIGLFVKKDGVMGWYRNQPCSLF